MKTRILLVVLFASAISLSALELKVPPKVKDAFAKLYPKAVDIKWGKEGKNEFEAEFKDQNNSISVVLNTDGKLLETETSVAKSQLPKGVVEYIAKSFAGYSITEAAKIVNSNNVVTFEAEVTKGKEKKDLMFTQDGKPIVKKEKKK